VKLRRYIHGARQEKSRTFLLDAGKDIAGTGENGFGG
jgi:hypothetical protein